MFKYSHSVSLLATGLQLVKGHNYDFNAKITAMHQSRWPNLFPNILFFNSKRILFLKYQRQAKCKAADTLPNMMEDVPSNRPIPKHSK